MSNVSHFLSISNVVIPFSLQHSEISSASSGQNIIVAVDSQGAVILGSGNMKTNTLFIGF